MKINFTSFQRYFIYFIFLILIPIFSMAQNQIKRDTIHLVNHSISGASGMFPVHPLAIFSLHIAQNFREKPISKPQINFEYSSGNIWLPMVNVYFPYEQAVKDNMQTIPWHYRQDHFDVKTMKADKISLAADGIIRKLRFEYIFPIFRNQEISFAANSYLLDKGKLPFSIFTSDAIIEGFHSNIYGGNDPFDRKYYGFGKAEIIYTDKQGKQIHLKSGDFFVPVLEANYMVYPEIRWLQKAKINCNLGLHASANVSSVNRSLDLGISGNISKSIDFKKDRSILLGFGLSRIKQQIIKLKTGVDLGSNKTPFFGEGLFQYSWKHRKHGYFQSFSINYLYRGPFYTGYPLSEGNRSAVIAGYRRSSHWHLAGSHLLRNNQTWNFSYTFTRKYTISIYLQEDLRVNNAPDMQTGIVVKIPVNKK